MATTFDLEDRATEFAKGIIDLCRKFRNDVITTPIISQLIRSATSIGANYAEANAGVSKKDFRNKIGICKKEAKETMFWLKMLDHIEKDPYIQILWNEAKELTLIFSSIVIKSR